MPILHIDPDYKRTVNPQSDRSDVSRGFMRDIPGVSKAQDNSGRLIIRAVNDNQPPTYAFGRSLLKRMIVGLYCWHLLPVSVAQRAIDRLRIWGA